MEETLRLLEDFGMLCAPGAEKLDVSGNSKKKQPKFTQYEVH